MHALAVRVLVDVNTNAVRQQGISLHTTNKGIALRILLLLL